MFLGCTNGSWINSPTYNHYKAFLKILDLFQDVTKINNFR